MVKCRTHIPGQFQILSEMRMTSSQSPMVVAAQRIPWHREDYLLIMHNATSFYSIQERILKFKILNSIFKKQITIDLQYLNSISSRYAVHTSQIILMH